MRSHAILAVLAGAAIATPVPQGLDFAAVDAVQPKPEPTIPVFEAKAAQTTVSFVASQAASSVVSAVLADPTDTSLKMAKRADNSGCTVEPASGDTADAFLANPQYPAAANSAATPNGYSLAYQNKQASSQGVYGYMGYAVLDTYDVQLCSSKCDAVQGCSSFNICKCCLITGRLRTS